MDSENDKDSPFTLDMSCLLSGTGLQGKLKSSVCEHVTVVVDLFFKFS